jgi:hypothetical protein
MSAFHESRHEEQFDVEISTVNGVTSYTVNGRKYEDLEDVPPAARRLIEKIQDKSLLPEPLPSDAHTTYEVNGVKYDNLEDVPPEFRSIIAGIQAQPGRAPGRVHLDTSKTVRHFYLDGEEYGSFEEMAPHLRKKVEDMIEGPNTTIEYVTRDGVTRKYVDGAEVPLPPGEEAPLPESIEKVADAAEMEYGHVRKSLPKAELFRKIVVNRQAPSEEIRELSSLSSPFRRAEEARRAIVTITGRIITTAAYVALILWTQFQPAGFSSYVYLGFLIGDIVSWLIFTVWGWQKNYVEFDYRDLGIRAAGLFFFILLTTREGAFEVASHLRSQAIAALVMMAAVAAFAKWTTRMFGLIKRITEGS